MDETLKNVLKDYGRKLYEEERNQREDSRRRFEAEERNREADERRFGYNTYSGTDRDIVTWHPPTDPDYEDSGEE